MRTDPRPQRALQVLRPEAQGGEGPLLPSGLSSPPSPVRVRQAPAVPEETRVLRGGASVRLSPQRGKEQSEGPPLPPAPPRPSGKP